MSQTDLAQVQRAGSRDRVFLVHGRDEANNEALRQLLRTLGLRIVDWEHAVSATKVPNPFVNDVVEAGIRIADAVIVLFTPDDLVRLRSELVLPRDPSDEREERGQPRPNVVYEAGLARGIAPDSTVLVAVGDVKLHSDIAGRHLVRIDESAASRNRLVGRLEIAGLSVDRSGSEWLSAGRFVLGGGTVASPSASDPEWDVTTGTGDEEKDDNDGLGFLELLANLEDALPSLLEIMTELSGDIRKMGEMATEAVSEMKDSDARGAGSRGRLSTAIQFAEALEPMATKSESLVKQLQTLISSGDGGIRWLFGRINSGDLTEEEKKASRDFLKSMVVAGGSAREAIPSVRNLIASFNGPAAAARPLKKVTNRLSTSYRGLITMMEYWVAWGEEAQSLIDAKRVARLSQADSPTAGE